MHNSCAFQTAIDIRLWLDSHTRGYPVAIIESEVQIIEGPEAVKDLVWKGGWTYSYLYGRTIGAVWKYHMIYSYYVLYPLDKRQPVLD